MAYFSKATFKFFTDLRKNNQREWFQTHKPRYIKYVRDPFLQFIADVDHDLPSISKHYFGDSRANGGSLFRIYRDVRFSKDKTPYKTWAGVRFKHQDSATQAAPTLYLHIQPGNHFMGAGIWHPATPVVNQIRDFIHNNPNAWNQLKQDKPFQDQYQLSGKSLKRMPRGYDAEHPLAEDLKRKDFVISTPLTDEQVLSEDFKKLFIRNSKIAAPFLDYLCAALDLDF